MYCRPFINHTIKKHAYIRKGIVDKDDYVSACNFAYAHAKKTYDASKGAKFNTHLYYKMRKEITIVNRYATKHSAIEMVEKNVSCFDSTLDCIDEDVRLCFDETILLYDEFNRSFLVEKLIHKKTYAELRDVLGYSKTTLSKKWKILIQDFREKFRDNLEEYDIYL